MRSLSSKILTSLFCLAWFVSNGSAQIEEAWRKRLNGEGNGVDEAKAIVADGAGNVYIAGSVVGTGGVTLALITKYNANGDVVWSSNDGATGVPLKLVRDAAGNLYMAGTTDGAGTMHDFFVAKYNNADVPQWFIRYDGSPSGDEVAVDFAVDNAGNIYVTGSTAATETNFAARDILTVKYDSNQQLQWARQYNGLANERDFANGVALDNSGNIYVAGYSRTTPFFSDYVTIKYNSAGVQQWAAHFDGSIAREDQAVAVATDNAGNVYVTGYAHNPHGSMTTLKYGSDGATLWSATTNVNFSVQGTTAIELDGAGNVYVVGFTQGAAELWRYYLVKYDNAGALQWETTFVRGDANPTDMIVDASGNIYITGYSGLPTTFPVDFSKITYDYTTVKFNSAGVREWFVTLTENADSRDFARAMALDASGNVYVTGRSIDDIMTVKYRPVASSTAADLVADRVYLRTAENAGNEVTAPLAGEPYFVHVDWRNTGTESASNFRLEMQLNGGEVCALNIPSASGNSSQTTACSSPVIWPEGGNVITAVLDGFGQVTEEIENNNSASRVYGFATFDDFELSAQVRSTDDFTQNGGADFCFIYGYQDEYHYYYVMFNRAVNESRVYKVRGTERIEIGNFGSLVIPDNAFHEVRLVRSGGSLQIFFDGASLGFAGDIEYRTGGIGLGSYNDAPLFDEICIRPSPGAACMAYEEFENGLAENWRTLNPSRWHVTADGGDNAFGINTSTYTNLDPLRLGEYSLFAPRVFTPCPGPALYPVAAGSTDPGATIRALSSKSVSIDVRVKENKLPMDAFGFTLNVDPSRLALVSATRGDLTQNFVTLNAQENPPGSGKITCGGFGSTAIPANSAGVLVRLTFAVQCSAGDSSAITLTDAVDDATALSLCGNVFRCLPCVSDGDVNADSVLTPGDALCAFQIYLNNGALPASCDDAHSECEVKASDANCDARTTPGDALAIFTRYLQNLPPAECFGQTSLSKISVQPRLALQTRTALDDETEFFYATLSAEHAAGLSSFGLSLDYPLDKLQFIGVKRASLTAEWIALEGKEIFPGQIMLGGFHSEAATATRGEVFEIIFTAKGRTVASSELQLRDLTDDFKQAYVQGSDLVSAAPSAFNLYQSSPNPYHTAQGEMSLRFDLPGEHAVAVELSLYNLSGQLVRQLLKGERAPGTYDVRWDGRDANKQLVPSGTYLYRLKAGTQVLNKRMTVVR